MVRDKNEEFIEKAIASRGWAVNLIPAGDSNNEPAFAYTTGLYKSFWQAELICFGLRHEVMHGMLNICGDRMKTGEKLPVGVPLIGVIEGYPVFLREVLARNSYDEHVGYSNWFYRGRDFPLMQVVWPDKHGRFPGDPGIGPSMAHQQPLLP